MYHIIKMLASYDSDGNFVSIFKNQINSASDDAKKFFDVTQTWDLSVIKTKDGFDNLCKSINVSDENLLKFLSDEKYGTKDLASYNQYLKTQSKHLDLATVKTKGLALAQNLLINVGFALASVAIVKTIESAAKAIDDYVHRLLCLLKQRSYLYKNFLQQIMMNFHCQLLLNSKYMTVVSNSALNCDSGSISGTFLKMNEDDVSVNLSSSLEYRNNFKNRLANKKPLILKIDDGRIWMIRVSSNPNDTRGGHCDIRQINFEWVEIGDVNDMKR